jgi:serine phosphatase RsbU (regulator of sigma subunit)
MKNRLIQILLALFFFILTDFKVYPQPQGQQRLDQLLKDYSVRTKKDTSFLTLLSEISFAYYQIDPDKGIQFGKEGLALAQKLKSKPHKAKILNSLAVNYWSQSRYNEALQHFSEALQINEEKGDKNGISRNLGNMGMVYYNLSDYPKALEYFFKAVKTNEEMGSKEGMANKYSNIGLVYESQKNFNKALEYYNKSLELNQELGNKNGIAINLGNIGNTYNSLKDYHQAIKYHSQALELDQELGNKRGTASDYGNLGEALTELGNYSQAMQYQLKALDLRKEINNNRGIMFSYGGLSNIYLRLAKEKESKSGIPGGKSFHLKQCISYASQAIEKGKQINALKETGDYYLIMAQAYKELNEWKIAYLYADSFDIFQDSVFNVENRLKMATVQNQRDKELQEKEVELMKSREERRRTAIIAISGCLIMMLAIALLIYRNLNHKSKISKLLQEKYQLSMTQKDGIQIAHNMIQKEVKKASKYLTSLLPHPIDKGPFRTDYLFIPSSQLGGDSFGYHWIDEEHFAVYIIDVCGHGISSALHSVSVLNILRSAKRLNADPRRPEKVVTALNDSFRMEEHGDLFFSIWYGVLKKGNALLSPDSGGMESDLDYPPGEGYPLSYICAGHPNPLLFEPSGEIRELGPSSLAVGCMRETAFQSRQLRVPLGSKLLLFSDGTYEVTQKDGSIMDILEFKKLVVETYHQEGLSLQHINKVITQRNTVENYEDDFSLLLINC